MFFWKKRRIKRKIRDLEIRIDVITRLIEINIAKIGNFKYHNNTIMTQQHYENSILNQEKIEKELEIIKLKKLIKIL